MSDTSSGKNAAENKAARNSTDIPPKPVPVPDAASQPFFDGARQGRLMMQRCEECGNARFTARARCDVCRSPRHAWVQASGKATIVSYAVMHQRYHPGFFDDLPYPLAVVELEEGPRFITSLVGVEGVELKAGMAMKAVFEEMGEGMVLPRFTPA